MSQYVRMLVRRGTRHPLVIEPLPPEQGAADSQAASG
jgi:hypothetical protein